MEIWHNKFYKRLDNNALVSDSTESDIIVCYELPCNSQQTHGYKRQPEEPFVVPVFLSQATSATARTSYGRSTASLFGYPFFVAIGPSQAKSVDAISAVLTDRLSRWTTQARDLYKWELGPGSGTEVTIPLDNSTLPDAIAEIQENGEVVAIEQEPAAPPAPEEGDITDETPILVTQDEDTMDTAFDDAVPRKVGPKSDVFTLRVQGGYTQQNSSYSTYGSYGSATTRYEAWETRQIEEDIPLLKEGDALYCEFDENMQLYYFGEERTRWEHAGWNHWTEFVHEEVAEARKASGEKKTRGITLRDCLDEFTKEEKLGEDDLWYCPQCKKHQQATKKFDIWKVPDILVVHLKRFSSSRALRDKIDTFVDFPVEGLDLESMIHERKVAATLREQGVSLDGLGLGNLEEPMIYDLFAVDEHLGGLGGGHYRAYALNHTTNKWYHFDDSYVTESRAQDAVVSSNNLFTRKHPLISCRRMQTHIFSSIEGELTAHLAGRQTKK
jgi:ubiquitin carboxyl-terminal hydrolase 4/11